MHKPQLLGFSTLALLLFPAPGFAGFAPSAHWHTQGFSHDAGRGSDSELLRQVRNETQGRPNTTVEFKNDERSVGQHATAWTGTSRAFGTGTSFIQLNDKFNRFQDSRTATTASTFRRESEQCHPEEWTPHDYHQKTCDQHETCDHHQTCDSRCKGSDKHDPCKTITHCGQHLEDCCKDRSQCCKEPCMCCPKNPGCPPDPGCPPSVIPEPASVIVWSLLGGVAACGRRVRRRHG
jgi:hypothetical protein